MNQKSRSREVMRIQSREHLLSALAEASQLEHNLMCLYLFVAFSLKQSISEDVTIDELLVIKRWKKAIMEVAIEEMAHLAQVANLISAIGGSAQFDRPHFPVKAGYFPKDFVIELGPFSQAMIDHLIFLERPTNLPLVAPKEFQPDHNFKRGAADNRLMTHLGDYETVGELYEAIADGIQSLTKNLGENTLFCGSRSIQLSRNDIEVRGLEVIDGEDSALRSIRTIVEQGEGSMTTEGSHFEKYSKIKEEYEALLALNPKFNPARSVASNPVMRKPVEGDQKTWINHPFSAKVLDIGNAIYSMMLTCLSQLYSMEHRSTKARSSLVETTFCLMHSIATVGNLLSLLPASEEKPSDKASLNFAMNRSFGSLELSCEQLILVERVSEIKKAVSELQSSPHADGFGSDFQRLNLYLSDGLAALSKLK